MQSFVISFFFFFNDPATTEIYTLSLHDALPISRPGGDVPRPPRRRQDLPHPGARDRKSTRLNSSHLVTSYAVFCLKKKIKTPTRCSRSPCFARTDVGYGAALAI